MNFVNLLVINKVPLLRRWNSSVMKAVTIVKIYRRTTLPDKFQSIFESWGDYPSVYI